MENSMVKILMIDDNQDNLTILKTLILEAFPETSVLSALNGQKGLDLAASEEPDIILLDIIMPGLDGFEVCRRLKADEKLCDIPVVFVTAIRSNKESRIRALECGAEAFLTKPIDDIELTAQIRAMLKIRAANIQKRDEKQILASLVEEKTKELQAANTELMKTVEALKREQALIEAIFNSIPGYLYVYDESGKLIKWNNKHETMTGYSTEELAHMSLAQWFDQKDIIKVHAAVHDVFEKGYGEVEAWLKLKNGGRMLTRSSGVPLFMNGQKYFTGIGLDISEQKRLENALLESQRIAHLGTWNLDLITNQVVWSEELYKMYGFDPAFPPPPYPEHMKLFTPESWIKLSSALDHTRISGIPYELELQTVMKDGSNGWMWVRGEAKKDTAGNIVSLWGAAQDITRRKRTEIELKQSEERFELLFNKAPLGYQSLDFDGHFIEVNQQWLDTLGYTREEVIGKWFGDFLCPEYVEGFRKRFPLFKAQGFIHSEFEMLAKNGNRLFMAFEGRIGFDFDGNFVQTHCILKDITDQRKAEAALQESEERYKFLFEYSGVGIGYYTTDGVVISYNKKALENIGGKLEDYVGKSIYELFQDDQADIYFSRIKRAISSDDPQIYEDYLILNSRKKWYSSTFTKVSNAVGEIIGVQIASLDITQRKEAEEALQENERANKLLLDHLHIGIVLHNADSSISFSNPLANKLLRLSADQMQNKHVSDKTWCFYDTHGEPLPVESYPFSLVYKDKKLINYEMGISQEGLKDIRWFLVNGFAILDKTGDLEKVLISFIDITEKKQAEEALSESQALLKAAFETSQAGIVILDAPSGKLRYVNKAGLLIRNKTQEEIQKDNDKLSYIKRWNLFHLDGTPYAEEEFILARAFLFGETRSDEFIIQRDDLENRYVLAHAAPIRNPMGIISAGVIVFLDITDKKKAEEGIQHLAYHDYLTDTYNRRFFENEYDSKNTGEYFPLVIVTGDLNGLKLINDSFGHSSGDLAIQQFAIEIRKRIPENAILARVGGDEFSIILSRSSEEEARQLTSELQSNIRFGIKDNKGNDVGAELTATFGYSCQSFPGQGLDDLAKEAETFMYRRKFLESTSKRSNVIDAIMSTLFEKSEREQKHSLRVSNIATAIATAMGLDDTTVAKVRVAGSLHDIGKIGIDESILNKTEKLNDQEWELIKQHPIRSARILASVDEYLDIVPIVKAHHERIDGNGYPAGLSDKQIPLEAKIISVADSFDAMTVTRPYRDRVGKEIAAEELKRCAGSQFDREVVDVFIRVVLSGSDSFET